jgi:hypothetical protein
MTTDPTLVIVLGFDEPNSNSLKVAQTAKGRAEEIGRKVEIIGDGTYAPTLKEVHDRIAAVGGPAEVYLSAHGESIPPDQSSLGLGDYVVTLSDGVPRPPEVLGELPNGVTIDRSQVVSGTDFLKALPDNTVGVMAGACYSEYLLKDVDVLPQGTKLYVTSTKEATTLADQSEKALTLMSGYGGGVNDGSNLTEAYGLFLAGFRNEITFSNKVWKAETPTRFAISGEGQIDVAEAAKKLEGYAFPDKLYAGFVDPLNMPADKKEQFAQDLKNIGVRVTNGELGTDKRMDNRSYNIVLTEIARVANEEGLTMGQALSSMEQQAATAREAAKAAGVIEPVNAAKAVADSINDPRIAAIRAAQPAYTDHETVQVPAAAAQTRTPPGEQVGANGR